jgi:hypothetical protein
MKLRFVGGRVEAQPMYGSTYCRPFGLDLRVRLRQGGPARAL